MSSPPYDDILTEVRALGVSLAEYLEGAHPGGDDRDGVWSMYARAERLAAKLKFRLGLERPGVFLEVPRSEAPEEFLPLALDALRDSEKAFDGGDVRGGLESLRTGRTYLRAYLSSKRRIESRAKRRSGRATAKDPTRAA